MLKWKFYSNEIWRHSGGQADIQPRNIFYFERVLTPEVETETFNCPLGKLLAITDWRGTQKARPVTFVALSRKIPFSVKALCFCFVSLPVFVFHKVARAFQSTLLWWRNSTIKILDLKHSFRDKTPARKRSFTFQPNWSLCWKNAFLFTFLL